MSDKLPDVLSPGLDVVFVGTAAGTRSADEGIYYAHPGNKFWRTAIAIGLLPKGFAPADFRRAVEHGIGFTDMCKTRSGSDVEIGSDGFDRARFERSIRRVTPRAVAFTSKKAASAWLRVPTSKLRYGEQDAVDGFPAVFVLPSPSGAAAGHWDEAPWRALAAWVKRRPPRPRTARSPG
ncbi:MAG: mismatch-specific DNA-glycosylase [Alphaproteobacteria bacterium]|nr:mismatch-specific DNA-glycosylase [Alphaproteobacteria bacterium]